MDALFFVAKTPSKTANYSINYIIIKYFYILPKKLLQLLWRMCIIYEH